MNHYRRRTVAAFALLFALSAAGLYACAPEEKGPLEKAGEKIDEKVSDTKRAVEDAAD